MTDMSAGEAKIVRYLAEAQAEERKLEAVLSDHIAVTSRKTYKDRLQRHLRETRDHAKSLESRIKQLGGEPETLTERAQHRVGDAVEAVQSATRKAASHAQGPIDSLRGTGEQEKLLANARAEYTSEAGEIATYTAIEALAEALGDTDTAKLARGIRRDEERMSKFLADLIPTLVRASVKEEIAPPQPVG
jgi:ferritin-like metal-binding protein YciE